MHKCKMFTSPLLGHFGIRSISFSTSRREGTAGMPLSTPSRIKTPPPAVRDEVLPEYGAAGNAGVALSRRNERAVGASGAGIYMDFLLVNLLAHRLLHVFFLISYLSLLHKIGYLHDEIIKAPA